MLYNSCQKKGQSEVDFDVDYQAIHDAGNFVGDLVCMECHQNEYDQWKGSHHDLAMKEALPEYVKGDFDSATVNKGDLISTFYRVGNKFIVNTQGPDGKNEDYEIKYTFGVYPLQQYLVEFPGGRLQALHTAWDSEKNQWFYLYPELDISNNEWLHWTKGGMNWNSMCADCHSTNVRKNFNSVADKYNTTWNSINVSCEACHGAGNNHIGFVNSVEYKEGSIDSKLDPIRFIDTTNIVQIESCAPCHSRRSQLATYEHQGNFFDYFIPEILTDGSYHPDGQILDEVYVYGSFLQSKMYAQGVKCSDCHDPHSLKLKGIGNQLCLSCHDSSYDTEKHHFHPMNTESAKCISCHMPGKIYMENDFRRDHSFRVPRPDLTVEYGTPNSCNSCHDNQTPEWAAEKIKDWYKHDPKEHFSDILTAANHDPQNAMDKLTWLIQNREQPVIARATAITYLSRINDRETFQTIVGELAKPHPLIKISAIQALAGLSTEERQRLLIPLLNDSVRGVRITAFSQLADVRIENVTSSLTNAYRKAESEYVAYLQLNADFRGGQFMYGQYYQLSGQVQKAEDAYLKSLAMDSMYNPSRVNLGILYNQLGRNQEAINMYKTIIQLEPDYGPAYYSLGLLMGEEGRLEESLEYLQKAVSMMMDNSRVYYNLGIVNQNLGKTKDAERAYLDGLSLVPETYYLRRALVILYLQQDDLTNASNHIDILLKVFPDDPELLRWKGMVE